jgi:hypothetical protein
MTASTTSSSSLPFALSSAYSQTSITFASQTAFRERYSFPEAKSDVSLIQYREVENFLGNTSFICETEDIASFLLDNYFLVSFLRDAETELSNLFPGCNLFLEAIFDAEVQNWCTLFIGVLNNFGTQDFNQTLELFVSEWMFLQETDVKKFVTIREVC